MNAWSNIECPPDDPEIKLIDQLEKSLDFERVKQERAHVIGILAPQLKPKELKNLVLSGLAILKNFCISS